MGDCIYCGNPAGFLRKKHPECEQKYTEGWTQMVDYSRDTALGVKPLDSLVPTITKVASTSFVPPERIREAMTRGWSQAVSKFLEDNILQEDEEHKLVEFMNRFKFDQQSLDADGSYTKVVKAGTLRDIMDGRLPRRIKMDSSLPFNFQKDETPVWAFTTVRYFEDKVRREYVGGYQGVSVRVAKGLYYRTGGFRENPLSIPSASMLILEFWLLLTSTYILRGL